MSKNKIQSRLKFLLSQYKDILIRYPHPDKQTSSKTYFDYCQSKIEEDAYSITFGNLESEILRKLQEFVSQNADVISQCRLEIDQKNDRIVDLEQQLAVKAKETGFLRNQLNEVSLPSSLVETINSAISNIDEAIYLLSGGNMETEVVKPILEGDMRKNISIPEIPSSATVMQAIRDANLTERDLKICIAYFRGVDQESLAKEFGVGKASLYVYECSLQRKLSLKSRRTFRSFFNLNADLNELNEMLRNCERKQGKKLPRNVTPLSLASGRTERPHRLSKREVEIFNLLKTGNGVLEIADSLFICEKTVKFHITRLYRKLEIKGRSDFLSKHGLSPDYDLEDLLKYKYKFLLLGEPRKTILKLTMQGLDSVTIANRVGLSDGRIKSLTSELSDLFGVQGKYQLILKFKNLPYDEWEGNLHKIELNKQAMLDSKKNDDVVSLPSRKERLSNALNYGQVEQITKAKPVEVVTPDCIPELPFGNVQIDRKAS